MRFLMTVVAVVACSTVASAQQRTCVNGQCGIVPAAYSQPVPALNAVPTLAMVPRIASSNPVAVSAGSCVGCVPSVSYATKQPATSGGLRKGLFGRLRMCR